MFKTKGKLFSLLTACLTAIFALVLGFATLFAPTPVTTANAAETTETLSITGTTGTLAADSSSISWTQNGVTFTNNKASSSTAIRTSDSDHYRVYAKSEVVITAPGNITEIVVTSSESKYVSPWQTSATNAGATVTTSGTEITITPSETSNEFTLTASAQIRLNKIAVTYEAAAACEHTDTVYTYENGMHTLICANEECKKVVEEATACTITSPTYVRNGNQHIKSGKCSVCEYDAEIVEACTTKDSYTSNDNGTHKKTNTCSVCNKSIITESETCTFGEGVVEGTLATYTCEHCGYSYKETVETYTVSFSVPDGIAAVEDKVAVQGEAIILPEAGSVEDYTFVGWTTDEYSQNTDKPATVYAAGTELTLDNDLTLYALYSFSEGSTDWTLVKDAKTLNAGTQIVIVASAYNYALGTTQNNNNRASKAITKNANDTVTINDDVQIITLEDSTVNGQFLFYVEGDSIGYLYAASTSSNHLKTGSKNGTSASWAITIANTGVATIKANQSARNWLRFNNSNDPKIFSCYTSGQTDVSIYAILGDTFYTTSFDAAACQHPNTTTTTIDATCTETGLTTITCDDCGATVSEETLAALGHNYVEDICENCGQQDPASISYDGYYYIAFKRASSNYFYVGTPWDKSKDRYVATDIGSAELPDSISSEITMSYVFRFVKNDDGTYNIYEGISKTLFAGGVESVTLTANEDGTFYIQDSSEVYFSFNNTTGNNYIKWYTSAQIRELSLVPVELNANIYSADAVVEADITMNYYVDLSETFVENTTMQFVVSGSMYEISPVWNAEKSKYMFSLPNLAPHLMTENIVANLVCNGTTLDTEENYSVQTYVQNLLDANQGNTELVNFLTAMLYYGTAAQEHQSYNLDKLATTDVTGMAEVDTPSVEEDYKMSLVTNADNCTAWFEGANVWFSSVNKICVRISTTENVKLEINGVEVDVTGSTIYTDGIAATAFGNKVEFKLYHNGELMQTLHYSIYSYAYAKQTSSNLLVKNLTLALYRYGEAAKAYNEQ